MKIVSKYNYEKVWRPTSVKDLERIVSEEMPDAPIEDTIKYIMESCKAGKVVNFMEISFKREDK
jgi:hypothetical protein